MTRPSCSLGGLAFGLASAAILPGCAGLPPSSASVKAEAKTSIKAGDDRPGVEGSLVLECRFGAPSRPAP